MPSGWEAYGLAILSAALSLILLVGLRILAFLARGRRPKRLATEALKPAPGPVEGHRINSRFFVATNLAILLSATGLLMIPCSVIGERALIALLPLTGFAFLGLLYLIRKGDLRWLDSISGSRNGSDS